MIMFIGSIITLSILVLFTHKLFKRPISRYLLLRTEIGLLFFIALLSIVASMLFGVAFVLAPDVGSAESLFKLHFFFFRLSIALAIVFSEGILRDRYSILKAVFALGLFGFSVVALIVDDYYFVRFFGFWERVHGPVGIFGNLEFLSVNALSLLLLIDLVQMYLYIRRRVKTSELDWQIKCLYVIVIASLTTAIVLSISLYMSGSLVYLYNLTVSISIIVVSGAFYLMVNRIRIITLLGISRIIALVVFDARSYSTLFYREVQVLEKADFDARGLLAPIVVAIDWLRREFEVGTTAVDMDGFVALISMGREIIVALLVDKYSEVAERLVHIIRVQIENAIDYEVLKGLSLEEAKWRVSRIEIYNILEPILV